MLSGCIGLLASRAGAASRLLSLLHRAEVKVLRSRPAQAVTEEVVRVSMADLLAQKHSCEVFEVQEVNFDVSTLPRAAL